MKRLFLGVLIGIMLCSCHSSSKSTTKQQHDIQQELNVAMVTDTVNKSVAMVQECADTSESMQLVDATVTIDRDSVGRPMKIHYLMQAARRSCAYSVDTSMGQFASAAKHTNIDSVTMEQTHTDSHIQTQKSYSPIKSLVPILTLMLLIAAWIKIRPNS